jgi:hypothetical protein
MGGRGACGVFTVESGETFVPTILRVGRYRFAFFSNEGREPPHVHVKTGDSQAKFWLDPVQLAANFGFRPHELREIAQIVREHQAKLIEAWNEHFS